MLRVAALGMVRPPEPLMVPPVQFMVPVMLTAPVPAIPLLPLSVKLAIVVAPLKLVVPAVISVVPLKLYFPLTVVVEVKLKVPLPVTCPPFRVPPCPYTRTPGDCTAIGPVMVPTEVPSRFKVPLETLIEPEPLMGTRQLVVPVPLLLTKLPVLLKTTAPWSATAVTSLFKVQEPELLTPPGGRT